MTVFTPELVVIMIGVSALAWMLRYTRDLPKPLLLLENIAGRSFSQEKINELAKRLEALKIPIPAMSIVTAQTGVVITCLLLGFITLFRSPLEGVPFLILSAIVLRGPEYALKKLEQSRKDELAREFPRMVDNIRIYTKASDIYTALKTVHFSLRGKLAEEMRILSVEMEMNDLEAALNNLRLRCGLRQADDFASVVLQAARSGMDVDSILSNYSKAAYEKRVGEIRRKIKARPIFLTIIPAVLLLCIIMLWFVPMYNDIITRLRSF
ncbi:MAG: type II secretion system F family protein [Bacillota bacterium]